MLKLGVNIDHVTTLREARYRGQLHGEPCPIEAIKLTEAAGAHGITAHLREDRRHIQDRDIWAIRDVVKTRLNFEMANTEEMVNIATKLKPEAVCLVPENRNEVTTEGGLDVTNQIESIKATNEKLSQAGIEVSLFIDPDLEQIKATAQTGCPMIELHTGAFAESFADKRKNSVEIERLTVAAAQAKELGLIVNAGHGINYQNVQGLFSVPHLKELNIGHSIISRAITVGLGQATKEMLTQMAGYYTE